MFPMIFTWILIEVYNYFHFINKRKELQKQCKPIKPLTKEQRAALFWDCVKSIPNLNGWLEGWFFYKNNYKHPAFKDIKKQNLAIWFAWAFWHDDLEKVNENKEWKDEIDWMIASVEDWFGIQLPVGHNPDIQCIRLNLDPVEAYYRPFFVYFWIYVITHFFQLFYFESYWKFQHHPVSSSYLWGGLINRLHPWIFQRKVTAETRFSNPYVSYYYRPGSPDKTPMVFIHGIGAGTLLYTEFIHRWVSDHADRPLFIIELPYVAMRMVDKVPNAEQTVLGIQTLLKHHGFEKAVFVSHSLGTGVTSWIMKIQPKLVAGLVMVDPICFLLHYPHVAFNFVHRLPKTLIQYVMHYGAARELYISHYISRHFQWFETIYFTPSDNSDPSLSNACIFLSEKDGIVGSLDVYQYLSKRGVNVHMMHKLEHAMFLINSNWKNTILKQINQIALKADKNH